MIDKPFYWLGLLVFAYLYAMLSVCEVIERATCGPWDEGKGDPL